MSDERVLIDREALLLLVRRYRSAILVSSVAVMAVVTILLRDSPAVLVAHLPLVVGGSAAAVIDGYIHRLPRLLIAWTAAAGFGLLALVAVSSGAGWWGDLARAAAGGLVAAGVYLVMVLVHPPGMGVGDVRMAGLVGMYAGWWGWPNVVAAIILPLCLAALPAAVLLVAGRRGQGIPLGPFFVVGYLVVLGVAAA